MITRGGMRHHAHTLLDFTTLYDFSLGALVIAPLSFFSGGRLRCAYLRFYHGMPYLITLHIGLRNIKKLVPLIHSIQIGVWNIRLKIAYFAARLTTDAPLTVKHIFDDNLNWLGWAALRKKITSARYGVSSCIPAYINHTINTRFTLMKQINPILVLFCVSFMRPEGQGRKPVAYMLC